MQIKISSHLENSSMLCVLEVKKERKQERKKETKKERNKETERKKEKRMNEWKEEGNNIKN